MLNSGEVMSLAARDHVRPPSSEILWLIEAPDQPPKGRDRRGFDGHRDETEELRQFVRAQRHTRDDAEASPSATLQSPEEVGVRARIGEPHLSHETPVSTGLIGLPSASRSSAFLHFG